MLYKFNMKFLYDIMWYSHRSLTIYNINNETKSNDIMYLQDIIYLDLEPV